jgi:hypothetical protein
MIVFFLSVVKSVLRSLYFESAHKFFGIGPENFLYS